MSGEGQVRQVFSALFLLHVFPYERNLRAREAASFVLCSSVSYFMPLTPEANFNINQSAGFTAQLVVTFTNKKISLLIFPYRFPSWKLKK